MREIYFLIYKKISNKTNVVHKINYQECNETNIETEEKNITKMCPEDDIKQKHVLIKKQNK